MAGAIKDAADNFACLHLNKAKDNKQTNKQIIYELSDVVFYGNEGSMNLFTHLN